MPEEKFTKTCPCCKETKPIECFGIVNRKSRSYCRECHNSAAIRRTTVLTEKRCPRCKEVKPISEFTGQVRRARKNNWVWTYCRPCNTIICRERSQARIKSGEARGDYKKVYATKRWKRLLKQYGVSQQEYESLEKIQDSLCAICGRPETIMYKDVLCRLVVDHDHDTGKVRGLLCRACNIALGNFREDENSLQRAIDYLRKHRSA